VELSLWIELDCISREQRSAMNGLTDNIRSAVEVTFGRLEQHVVHIIVVSDEYMRQLNRDYRHRDYVTDVLSFPMGEESEVTGEIYLCWSRILSQAEEYGHSWQREFSFLAVHGILHLLGYDHHEEPCPRMRQMEELILRRAGMGR